MSYENTSCPCGGKKQRETMLCQDCQDHLADTNELAAMNDTARPMQTRRSNAIRVLSMARKRKKSPALPLSFIA